MGLRILHVGGADEGEEPRDHDPSLAFGLREDGDFYECYIFFAADHSESSLNQDEVWVSLLSELC